jgi:hypothetical protein
LNFLHIVLVRYVSRKRCLFLLAPAKPKWHIE